MFRCANLKGAGVISQSSMQLQSHVFPFCIGVGGVGVLHHQNVVLCQG